MVKVSLKEFNRILDQDLIQLFEYVNNRSYSSIEEIEFKSFKDKTNTWCCDSNSEFFGIFNNNDLVGTICLSKQNMKEKRACIGYEIFPRFRKKGFATTAFKLILEKASKKNFSSLHATIQKGNDDSLNIWKNEGAVFTESSNNKVEAILNFNEK